MPDYHLHVLPAQPSLPLHRLVERFCVSIKPILEMYRPGTSVHRASSRQAGVIFHDLFCNPMEDDLRDLREFVRREQDLLKQQTFSIDAPTIEAKNKLTF